MTVTVKEPVLSSLFADKEEARRVVDEQYRKMGIVGDPDLTIEQVQAMVAADLRAAGIRREDNIFSRGIIAARDGDNEE